ncbi:MAG: ATP-binding cassette domain-containing protein, partial [Candidatus Gastranaerophilales bacterium]|nr:ATP-binding cassette domain-containing protein [Candidatus Gastranaerophilales bacterium]
MTPNEFLMFFEGDKTIELKPIKYTAGQKISPQKEFFLIKSGKVKVIDKDGPNPISSLEIGDICANKDFLNLEYIASDDTQIIELKASMMESNKLFNDYYNKTFEKLNKITATNPIKKKQFYSEKSDNQDFKEKELFETASDYNPFSLSWYFKNFAKNGLLSSQMILSSLMVQVFGLGMPIFYMVIFDRVFGRQNLSALDVIATGVVLILTFDLVIKFLRSYVLSNILEALNEISVEIFTKKIFNVALNNKTKQNNKNYLEKFGEIFKSNQSVAYTFLISSMDAAFSLIILIFLMTLNLKLSLIAIAPLIPLAAITFCKMPIAQQRMAKSSFNQKYNQLKLSEVIENADVIRTSNAQEHLLDKLSRNLKSSVKEDFWNRFDMINANADAGFIMNLGSFFLLYFGAHEVLNGNMSFGIYLAISYIGRNFVGGMQKMLVSLKQFKDASSSIEDLQEIFAEQTTTNNFTQIKLPKLNGNINLNEVCYRYSGNFPLSANNISMEINQGQKVVIAGNSGSGKSTLLNLISKLIVPTSGYITLDGCNISDIDEKNFRN